MTKPTKDAIEIVCRAMCRAQGTDPDEQTFRGQMFAGPSGSVVMPEADSPLLIPAWRQNEYYVVSGLVALLEAGYTIAAPLKDAA